MTSELSTVVQAIITDENEKYFFVQKSGETSVSYTHLVHK